MLLLSIFPLLYLQSDMGIISTGFLIFFSFKRKVSRVWQGSCWHIFLLLLVHYLKITLLSKCYWAYFPFSIRLFQFSSWFLTTLYFKGLLECSFNRICTSLFWGSICFKFSKWCKYRFLIIGWIFSSPAYDSHLNRLIISLFLLCFCNFK